MKRLKGFTLIEVLVVVAIILTLGALAMIGIGKATGAARRAESLNNVKQLAAISVADAGDNGGIFPEIHWGNLPFWFSQEWRDEAGISREMAYCSANKCWNKEGKDVCAKPTTDLWNFQSANESSMFGYACLTYNPSWADLGAFSEPKNFLEIRDRVTDAEGEIRWVPERTSQHEVVYPILWVDISAKWNNRTIGNFMKKDAFEGTHASFMDGHAEWIPALEMRQRFSSPGLTLFW